jgi:ABC-type antimicrobial peptide transport system permease subunit
MMNMLELFFQPFFLIFLWILLLVQLGMVMTHRQHHYAILLAKGMSWPQVRYLIFTQISLSFLVAIAVAVTITEIMQIILSIQVTDIITKEPYNEHIVAPQLNLLPLFFLDYLKVISLILITLFVATFSLLKVMIAQRYQQPAYLLQ